MKALKTKLIFIFCSLLILNLLISCGGGRNKGDDTPEVRLVGTTLKIERSLSDQSKRTAKRICDALRVKRSLIFEKNLIGEKLNLSIRAKYCQGPVDIYTEEVTLASDASGKLTYSSTTDRFYFKKVQTHINGELEFLCPQILRDETVNLLESTTFNQVRQIKFSSERGDSYTVIQAKQRLNQSYQITQVTKYYVVTAPGDKFGSISNTERDMLCDNSGEESYFFQK